MNVRQTVFTWIFGVLTLFVFVPKLQCQIISDRRSGAERSAQSETTTSGTPSGLPVAFHIKDSLYISAYKDVVRILRDKNACSDFFGGAAVLEVFDHMAAQMRTTYIDQPFGIRMYGKETTIQNADSSLHYRLFEKAEINGRGPFFHQNTFYNERRKAPIGRFSANTREARVLMLLHELGHLIRVSPGHWLLPNDGNDERQSHANTWTVQKYCEQAIKAKEGSE